MLTIFLTLTYLSCLSSGAMLSMLLLLVGAYISASLWLINQGVIYAGLLYVLVYVGAIVVLIMFVVQLTNTSLSGDTNTVPFSLLIVQNSILIVTLTVLILSAYSILNTDLLLTLSSLNLTNLLASSNNELIENIESLVKVSNNLTLLAYSIFNEYSYNLIISIHAIILAVIGPIKLAIQDLN